MTGTIPGPKGLPLVGNLFDIQDEVPLHAIERMADIYGPIYKIKFPGGGVRYFCAGFELFDELCNETRFYKVASKALQNLGKKGPAGLFTAVTEHDEDWGIAHRILMPAFGPLAIQGMFDEMYDIACQLALKWARLGPEHTIPATQDFTRLTLDTIALCTMDYRFNSFYQEEMHPFVGAMTRVLKAGSEANQLSGILKSMRPAHAAALQRDRDLQQRIAEEIVEGRKNNPVDKKDLLNAMIYNKDSKTGQTMSSGLIAANMQTFLIAGHETTSGLLSFAFLFMLKNPSTLFKAQREVDEVVGEDRINVQHLSKLPYVTAVLRETLRLCPTAPAFNRGQRPENKAKEPYPTIGNGRFAVPPDGIACLIGKIHRDPAVWGADANEFNPERMLDDKFNKLPKNAWKPFGTGSRGCIGRAFAWQEALLVVAMLLQYFDLRLEDSNYEMKIDQTLTIKPRDFEIRARLRAGITATILKDRMTSNGETTSGAKRGASDVPSGSKLENHNERSVQIMYGTTTGTTQSLANKLAATLSSNGWKPRIMGMDEAVGKIKQDALQVFITSSYEGMPPDNANLFVSWLEATNDTKAFGGVKFAVFGCGHTDWKHTFQRIPKLVDEAIAAGGGTRIIERGSCDAALGDIVGQFDNWVEHDLLNAISSSNGSPRSDGQQAPSVSVAAPIELRLSEQGRAAHLQQKVEWGLVKDARRLTPPGEPEKWHLDLELPKDMSYSVGDYLVILPRNSEVQVRRVLRRFAVPDGSIITISNSGSTSLPVNEPLPVSELLKAYVELSQPATKRDIATLASSTEYPYQKNALQAFVADDTTYTSNIVNKRLSVLDLLEHFDGIDVSFERFLAMLPPLKPRHYSISSSALVSPDVCSITYSVVDSPHLAFHGHGHNFQGVTGVYLRELKAGDQVQMAIRSTNKLFRLPAEPRETPLIMFCAGTGLAPFRGFVQERALLIREGHQTLAPALLFVGCRAPNNDQLYRHEMEEWERIGAVEIRYAFSREPDHSQGCKYVQDRIWHDREDVVKLWKRGAKVYICGSRGVAQEIRLVAKRLIQERFGGANNIREDEVEAWLQQMKNQRFVSDIFT